MPDKSVAELEKAVQAADKDVEKAREVKRKAARALEAKLLEADAERITENLSDAQKAALAQHIKAEGVKPKSAVGEPGA